MNIDKKWLAQILAGAAIFAVTLIALPERGFASLALYLTAYVILGGDIVLRAVRNILQGQVFDENFLMAAASLGAFIIGEYPEGAAVMLFYQTGELFQSSAVNKSRKSIADLMDIRPDCANVKRGGEIVKISPDEARIGDILVIRAGEKIPLDAKVIEGTSTLDTAALTGESIPRDVAAGDVLLSGCINVNGLLTAEVIREFSESTVSKILDLVENASSKKSNSENFVTKFARYYTPGVVVVAVLLALFPPLFIQGAAFSDWVYRALVFLVISCPCALVISIPLSFFGGIGGASKRGILVKGSNYLEALAQTEIVVFDKTGTLTKGVFKVREIHPENMTEQELLKMAACAEIFSGHPISVSLRQAYGKEIDASKVCDVEELSGLGVRASVLGKKVCAGNSKFMKKINIPCHEGETIGTAVHVAIDDRYAGYLVIADEIKEDSARAIHELRKSGVRRTVMLTGDARGVGERVARELGIDDVYSELLPADKVNRVEELLTQKSAKGKLVFVGDGINDAPVLSRADIGIAMGGLGADAAIEAADVVIMTDEPSKISTAVKLSRRTLRIVKQNIFFALGVKLIVLVLGAGGISGMWEAVFADVGVAVLAILNATRVLNVKKIT
ncbi:MAG: cadmium-translocating P-type ATPase [Synergistaceae bacterium]|nr:cadmium-translocating P-type ATPase [Synergistaceae bacterium]